jgi:hypothetical protein
MPTSSIDDPNNIAYALLRFDRRTVRSGHLGGVMPRRLSDPAGLQPGEDDGAR